MYLDATDDDLPGAIVPKLRYTISQDVLTVRIRLIMDDRITADDTLSANTGDISALAKTIAERIASLVVRHNE